MGRNEYRSNVSTFNVTYEMMYDKIHQKPNGFVKFMLKELIKSKVVDGKPYPKNGRTATQFGIIDEETLI